VRSATASGDIQRAQQASRTALQMNKIGIVIGIVLIILSMFFAVLAQLSWIVPLSIRG